LNRSSLFGALAVAVLLLALAAGNPFLPEAPRAPVPPALVVPAVTSERVTPVHAVPLATRAASPAGATLPDPDRVGDCPRKGIAVLRRGIDPADGRPTWWHVDGTITKRGVQRLRDGDVTAEVPIILTMTPQK
jgi:hypothetical protein